VSLLDVLHGRLVFTRRVDRLAEALAARLPTRASVLDIGCGDGSIAAAIVERRPDLSFSGVDVLVRPATWIPVIGYDGSTLPFPAGSYDAACLVDVVHHTDHPQRLLSEAARVSRDVVLIKDHVAEGFLAEPTLKLMDWVGNARHGVRLPYNYLTRTDWYRHFRRTGLSVRSWDTDLALYPPPLSAVFGRGLHVLIELSAAPQGSAVVDTVDGGIQMSTPDPVGGEAVG
jgi:SAM-dependent methyltransferase